MGRIPGPGQLESARLLRSFFDNPIEFYTTLRERWGDLVQVRCGPISMVNVFDVDAVQQLLVRDAAATRKGHGIRATRAALGDGLFTSDGGLHTRHRALAQPAFQPRHLQPFDAAMVEIADARIKCWEPGAPRNIHHDMIDISLRVVAETIMGAQLDTESIVRFVEATNSFNHAYRLMVAPGGPLWMRMPLPAARRFRHSMRYVDKLTADLITARRQDTERRHTDLLALLTHATDASGERFSDAQLRDHAVTLLAAGHETVAAALAWICAVLALRPDVQEAARAEIRSVLGTSPPTARILRELPYVRAVVQETLRLYPSVYSFVREPLEPYTIMGHTVRPGTDIAIPISAIQRDERHFPEPLRFDPARFLPRTDGTRPERHKLSYMPFGAGHRICIGSSYAMQELMLVTCRLLQQWSLRAADPAAALQPEAFFTMHPRTGPMLIPERWQP
jgi:cytochrome P450